MSIITWRDSYSIGIEAIDSQHKVLLSCINDLYEAQKNSTSQAIIKDVIEKLHDYTVFHFEMEEKMQIGCNFEHYESHKEEHQWFVNKVKELSKELSKNNILLSLKTLDFLKDWTINHILGSDKEFGEYLRVKEGV